MTRFFSFLFQENRQIEYLLGELFVKATLKRIFIILICILIVGIAVLPNFISAEEPNGPELNSNAALLYNLNTGETLYEKNNDKQVSIHSLSMLMTTYLLIEDIEKGKVKLKDKADISTKAWKAGEPRMFLEVGRKVTVEKLLEGLTVVAGKDAAIATAEHLSRSTEKFVERMNKKAKKLGMKDTTFNSPHGSSDDISTANDLFILVTSLLENYPEYVERFTQREMQFETRPGKTMNLQNQNSFLSNNEYATGLMSGSGNKKFHLITTVDKNGMNFLSITLNANSSRQRTSDTNKLLSYGYDQYQVIQLAKAGTKYSEFPVYKSTTPGPSQVSYKENVSVVTRVGVSQEELELEYEGDSHIMGGIEAGDEVGQVNVYHNGELLTSASIVSDNAFERTKGLNSALDSIALFFNKIFNSILDLF